MRLLMNAALLAATCFAFPAAAEEETLVVTATRSPTPAERLPADVDVIDVDQIQNQGVASVADALSSASGLDVVGSGGFGQQTSLFSGGANSNHTLVLFDGLRLNDPSTPGSSFDAGQDTLAGLDRIEVVQGPMSAVFGSDAIGGVVNLLPRRAGEAPLSARLDMGTGSFGTVRGAASVDGTLGRFSYVASAEGYVTDGYDIVPERMSTHIDDADGAESATLTGLFDVALTDSVSVDLLVRHREARADFDAFIYPPPLFSETRVDDADLEISKNDLTVTRLGADWSLSDALSLRVSAGALRQDREETDGGVTTSAYQGERAFADASVSWRADGAGGLSNVAAQLGVEGQREEVNIDQGFATVIAEQDHIGAFITTQGDVGALTLTGAARIDDFEGFGTHSTWRLGASFALTDSLRLYAAYGTGFRAPTLYERFIFFGDPNLNAEQSSAWEVGGDLRLAAFGQEDGIELGALYRRQDIDDLIDFGPFFTYVNIDEAEIESAELRASVRPLAWLTAEASYTYTQAEDATTGAALLRRPENAWRAALHAEHGPFTGSLAWRQVGERADQIYGDDGVYVGVREAAAFDLLRGSIAWTFNPSAQIYLAADNLTDEAYEPANAFAGAPRNVSVGIRLRR